MPVHTLPLNEGVLDRSAGGASRWLIARRRLSLQKMRHLLEVESMLSGTSDWAGVTTAGTKWEVHRGDAAAVAARLMDRSIDSVVTSPPYYWQRDYGVSGQIGLEATIDAYVASVCNVVDALRPKMKATGVVFLNLGDTYYSAKGLPRGNDPKSQHRRMGLRAVDASGLGVPRKTAIGIPWRVALELISRGWVLRSAIVWHRAASLPEPTAIDRPWRTYEHVFLLSNGPKYWFDRSQLDGEEDVWRIPAQRVDAARYKHSAPFPDALASRCIRLGTPPGGTVLDPFVGSGTTAVVAAQLGRNAIGIDLNYEFCKMTVDRLEMI